MEVEELQVSGGEAFVPRLGFVPAAARQGVLWGFALLRQSPDARAAFALLFLFLFFTYFATFCFCLIFITLIHAFFLCFVSFS